MSGPFKMKGSPMKRNFGVSPAKQVEEKEKVEKKKSNISTTKGSSVITNTDTGDTYGLKTGETTKNKKGRQKRDMDRIRVKRARE